MEDCHASLAMTTSLWTEPWWSPTLCVANGRAQGPAPTRYLSLSNVIERFKSLTTTRYIDGVKTGEWDPFCGKLWQRNYHDRIIRNEMELDEIRTYICNNPAEWDSDENNIKMK